MSIRGQSETTSVSRGQTRVWASALLALMVPLVLAAPATALPNPPVSALPAPASSGLPPNAPGTATGTFQNITQELHVTARVLPMRRVIIDQTGQIISIVSNTTEPVTPRVFVLSDTPEHEVPLTPSIQRQYETITENVAPKIGSIYQRSDIGHEATRTGLKYSQ